MFRSRCIRSYESYVFDQDKAAPFWMVEAEQQQAMMWLMANMSVKVQMTLSTMKM